MNDSTGDEAATGSGQVQDVPNDAIELIENTVPKVSNYLAETRIAQGFSQQDIAERLFLSTSHIENIDTGQFEQISKPAFLRGYLRAYARELGLSGDEIVAMYDDELSDKVDETIRLKGVTEQKVGSAIFTGPVATTAIYSLLGISLILAAIFWLNPEPKPELEQPSASSTDQNTPVIEQQNRHETREKTAPDLESARANDSGNDTSTDSEAALLLPGIADIDVDSVEPALATDSTTNMIETGHPGEVEEIEDSNSNSDLTDQGTAAENEPPISRSADGVKKTNDQLDASQREIIIDRTIDQGIQLINVSAGGDDHLQFVFTDECWLEITDASGKLVYGDLNNDQDILDLFGVAPFKILVGKVSAVTLTLNDRPVGFDGVTFNDTAKLVVK